jgi:methyl coenzyme M reductase subunit D
MSDNQPAEQPLVSLEQMGSLWIVMVQGQVVCESLSYVSMAYVRDMALKLIEVSGENHALKAVIGDLIGRVNSDLNVQDSIQSLFGEIMAKIELQEQVHGRIADTHTISVQLGQLRKLKELLKQLFEKKLNDYGEIIDIPKGE